MIAKVRNQTLDSFAGLGVVTHDTMAEYEALSQEEKMDGNIHLVLEEEPINANIVEYTDGKTVKDELDDIAEKTGNTDISAIGDGTTTGAIGSLNTQLSNLGDRTEDISVPVHSITTNGLYQVSLTPTVPVGYMLDHAEVVNKNSNYSLVSAVACTDVTPNIIRVTEIGVADFSSAYTVRAYFKKV